MLSSCSMGVQGEVWVAAAQLQLPGCSSNTPVHGRKRVAAKGTGITFRMSRQAQQCRALVTQLLWLPLLALAGLRGATAQQENTLGSGSGSDNSSDQGWRHATIALSTVLAAVLLLCLLALAFWYYRHRRGRSAQLITDLANLKDQAAVRGVLPPGFLPGSPRAEHGLAHPNAIALELALSGAAGSTQGRSAATKLLIADHEHGIRAADIPGSPTSPLKSGGRQGSVELLMAERHPSQRFPLASSRLLREDGTSTSTSQCMLPGSPAHSTKLLKVQAMAEEISGGGSNTGSEKIVLLQVIGKGGFGQVYKARWRGLEVAVKTVVFSEARGGTEQRALMEAAVCSSVVHNNVVCTYHYDISPMRSDNAGSLVVEQSAEVQNGDFKLYLVQELCTTSLRTVLYDGLLHTGDNGACDLDPVLTLLLDVARGLEYIHSKNIIHGDLKPENVLLKMSSTSPIGVTAKVTDFGLSQAISPERSHLSGIKGGTPYYQAPETAKKGLLTKSSDVYGYGVLMWEVYNKTAPWVKKPQGGYAYNRSFSMFPSNTPLRFCGLARRCLDPGPRNRPTIKEVMVEINDMLESYLDGYDQLCDPMSVAAARLRAEQLALSSASANSAMRSGPLPRLQAVPSAGGAAPAQVRPGVPQQGPGQYSPLRDGSGALAPALVSPAKTALREQHLMPPARHQSTELGPAHPMLQHTYSARRQSTELGPMAYKQQLYQMSGLGFGAPTRPKPHQPSKLVLPGSSAAPARAADRAEAGSSRDASIQSSFAAVKDEVQQQQYQQQQQQKNDVINQMSRSSAVQVGASAKTDDKARTVPSNVRHESGVAASSPLAGELQTNARTLALQTDTRSMAAAAMQLLHVTHLSSSIEKNPNTSPGPSPKNVHAADLTSHESKRPTGERSIDLMTASPRGSPQLAQAKLEAVTEADGHTTQSGAGIRHVQGVLVVRAASASLSGMVLSPASGGPTTATQSPEAGPRI